MTKETQLPKTILKKQIASQHTSPMLINFYNAIFLATPLSAELRQRVSTLGVSHLVALSGLHIGILWVLLYSTLGMVYTHFQKRYFPYRFKLQDMGFVALILLGFYVWFVGSPPSLIRAYVMVAVGWLALILGLELLSFSFLAFVVALILVLFPALSVSVGFWFSVAGVYYIYLLLFYFERWSNFLKTTLLLPLGLFFLMQPIVHGFFGVTSIYQLLSMPLSVVFTFFYPLSLLLHIVALGGLFDEALLTLFNLPMSNSQHLLSPQAVASYTLISLVAMVSKKWFYVLVAFALGYTIYVYIFS